MGWVRCAVLVTPLQTRTAETLRTQRFPSIARCVRCAAVVKWPFCSRLCFEIRHGSGRMSSSICVPY